VILLLVMSHGFGIDKLERNKRTKAGLLRVNFQEQAVLTRQDRFDPKTMFTIFFKSTGLVHCSYMDKGKTINARNYIEDSLKPLIQTIKSQRVKSGVKRLKLLHDNAKPHVAKNVIKFLNNEKLPTISHPPYSPDLAPCDFWLFDYIKQRLTDQRDAESLNLAVTGILKKIPKGEYLKAFQKWEERMKLCVTYKGEYFEHIINKNKSS